MAPEKNDGMRAALITGEKQIDGWTVVAWKAPGGMSGFAKYGIGETNRNRERIWFSPFCLSVQSHNKQDHGHTEGNPT